MTKDYSKIKHLKDLNNSMFNERMNRAYDYGYEDGLARGTECGYKRGYENGQKAIITNSEKKNHSDLDYRDGLEDGRMEAWEAVRKICKMSIDERSELFEMKSPYFDFTAQEVIEKLAEYEDKYEDKDKQQQDTEIKVGDEVYVYDKNHPRVVTNIFDDSVRMRAVQISASGKWVVNDIKQLYKTGRHFPQIIEVLEQMKGEADGK